MPHTTHMKEAHRNYSLVGKSGSIVSHTDKWEPVMIHGALGMCLGHGRAFQMSPGAGANRLTTRGGFDEDGPMGA